MKTKLDNIAKNLAKLQSVIGDVVLPEGLPSWVVVISTDASAPSISLNVEQAPNEHGKQQLLALFGDLFGRSGWMRDLNYGNTYFNWKTNFEGIDITINNAERLPTPLATPVSPRDFPITLHNAETVVDIYSELSD